MRVGSITTDFVAKVDAELENENGTFFRDFTSHAKLIAINTFRCAGKTCVSSYGTETRLDYLCVDAMTEYDEVIIEHDIDLSTAYKEDHRVPSARLGLVVPKVQSDNRGNAKHKAFRFNKDALRNPTAVKWFQDELWSFRYSSSSNIDVLLNEWVAFVQAKAMKCFGAPLKQPRQPWVRTSWEYVKLAAPLRRNLHVVHKVLKAQLCRFTLYAWRSLQPCAFQPAARRNEETFLAQVRSSALHGPRPAHHRLGARVSNKTSRNAIGPERSGEIPKRGSDSWGSGPG